MSIEIRAYRKSGGAVVTVVRDNREKKYRVGAKRFNRLKWVFAAWREGHGHSYGGSISIRLESPVGYRDAVNWITKYGCNQARQAMRA